MADVTFIIDGTEMKAPITAGETLLSIGIEAGVPIEHACGGNGFCTTCKCSVQAGAEHLDSINDKEENMGVDLPERLSCQAIAINDADIVVELTE